MKTVLLSFSNPLRGSARPSRCGVLVVPREERGYSLDR